MAELKPCGQLCQWNTLYGCHKPENEPCILSNMACEKFEQKPMTNPAIKKRVCDRCGKEFFETYKEWLCKDCMNELGWEYTPKTNADHIRSMTDEEMAEWMEVHNVSCGICSEYVACGGEVVFGDRTCDCDCATHYLNWLKQPYKEDT